ncbi:MAG: molybdopterin-dependent oxidoreductase, partial [Saprospiraceae bacterium]|nr:molybdopterin-dependent oxidoreductase [Saprospiraceae bacterium]
DKLIIPPRTFKLGNAKEAFDDCDHVFSGRVDTNGQEHIYIETQGAYGYPMENGSLRIASSTQGPTAVQKTAAKVLGMPMHKIEVDVTRLGGGFGGKEDQATAWGVLVGLGAMVTGRPVRLVLHRMDDMRMTGKRHPYSSDFKIGLSSDLKIKAYSATFHQNAGAAADLSPAVMERTLFHATNAYFVPNVSVTAYSCKTNLPPNTAFRGFGGPQGMFVIESAIRLAAFRLGVKPRQIQETNLIKDGDEFCYGQIADRSQSISSWKSSFEKYKIEVLENEIKNFNESNTRFKKGLAVMPVCFGISFTNTPMNNARALVHVYLDGSVGISTGGVEMGQGLNTKMVQVAAQEFGISADRIKIESTNTTRVANTSPSAASATADLNGKALEDACGQIRSRLFENAAKHLKSDLEGISIKNEWVYVGPHKSELDWTNLIQKANLDRVNLSAKGHYATPEIHFDKTKEKGHPFAYHTFGNSITIATVDCLRGIYTIDAVKIVHDFGKTMNSPVDYGQVEGGLVQGIGWMTMEELLYNEKGRLLSNALSTYKIPDIYAAPKVLEIAELETEGHPLAIRKSKAVGEPPLMYGMGAYFAIQQAIRAFNSNYEAQFDAPLTPEKVLMALYSNLKKVVPEASINAR